MGIFHRRAARWERAMRAELQASSPQTRETYLELLARTTYLTYLRVVHLRLTGDLHVAACFVTIDPFLFVAEPGPNDAPLVQFKKVHLFIALDDTVAIAFAPSLTRVVVNVRLAPEAAA